MLDNTPVSLSAGLPESAIGGGRGFLHNVVHLDVLHLDDVGGGRVHLQSWSLPWPTWSWDRISKLCCSSFSGNQVIHVRKGVKKWIFKAFAMKP